MSATPEQIAELCERLRSHAANASVISRQSIDMDAAAALIRAQSERVRVLEEAAQSAAQNLSKYIDRRERVDVNIALAFETLRAALAKATGAPQ